MKVLIPQGPGQDVILQPEVGDDVALTDLHGRLVTDWQTIPDDWTVVLHIPVLGAEHLMFRDRRDHTVTWYGDVDGVHGPFWSGGTVTLQPPPAPRLGAYAYREVPLVR